MTYTPNSPLDTCFAPGPCGPDTGAIGPQFAGTIGDADLALFNGVGATGNWVLRVFDGDGTDAAPITLTSAKLVVSAAAKK